MSRYAPRSGVELVNDALRTADPRGDRARSNGSRYSTFCVDAKRRKHTLGHLGLYSQRYQHGLRLECGVRGRPDQGDLALDNAGSERGYIDLHRSYRPHRVHDVAGAFHVNFWRKHLGLSSPLEVFGELSVEEQFHGKLASRLRDPLEGQGGRHHTHHGDTSGQIESLFLEVVPRLFDRLELYVRRGQVLLTNRVQAGAATLEPHANPIRNVGHQDQVLGIRGRLDYDVDVHVSFHVLCPMDEGEHQNGNSERASLEPEILGKKEADGLKPVEERAHEVSSALLTVSTAS